KATPATADSQLVAALRRHEWVPQEGDTVHFVIPAMAYRTKLPQAGFPYDAGHEWLKAIGFGDSTKATIVKPDAEANDVERQQRRQAANKLGFPPDAAELLAELAKSGLTIDDLKHIITERQPCEL